MAMDMNMLYDDVAAGAAEEERIDARGELAADDEPDDDERQTELVVAMVWTRQVLGLAFMQNTVLRFCEVADPAPDFRMLQAVKYALAPDVIIAPSSADPAWASALGVSSLLPPNAAREEEEEDGCGGDGSRDASGGGGGSGGDGGGGPSGDGGGIRVVRCKNRDFSADAAAKRLSLLRTLAELPDCEMTERDVLLYLEHVVPREHEQARRAICGLLSYLQRSEAGGGSLNVSAPAESAPPTRRSRPDAFRAPPTRRANVPTPSAPPDATLPTRRRLPRSQSAAEIDRCCTVRACGR